MKDEDDDPLTFDYVIVGAGPSAIGLLLGLVEPFVDGNQVNLPFSVALIDRGPKEESKDDLRRWFEASHDPIGSYTSLLMTSLNNRLVDVPIGKGLGGGSNINAGLCMAPPKEDFVEWPEPWRTNLPVALEKLQKKLSYNQFLWNAATGSELALEETQTGNYDWSQKVPCIATKANPDVDGQFQRINYFEALLAPLQIQNNPNFHCFCNTEAQRLLFEANRVVGVEILTSTAQQFTSILARKEVILCAGAIETPALLLVSGVGPEDMLTTDLLQLKGVGQGLRDHVILPRVRLGPPPLLTTSINGIHRLHSFAVEEDKFLLLTATTAPEIALHFFTRILQRYWFRFFFKTNRLMCHGVWKCLQVLLSLLVLYTPIYALMKYGLTTMNLSLVNARSTGTVTIERMNRSAHTSNPKRRKDFSIRLNLGYLQEEDIDALWRGWVASPVVCERSTRPGRELYPGMLMQSLYQSCAKAKRTSPSGTPFWFSVFAQDTCLPFFHWCGTCAMVQGDDRSDWVVDASCRVRSLEAIRICDASVLPNNLSVPPALTCAALGYVLASQMLQDGWSSRIRSN